MPENPRPASVLGRLTLCGGILLGAALAGGLWFQNSGFTQKSFAAADDNPVVIKRGETIRVPEGSPLRDRLDIEPAPVETIIPKLSLPGLVEADPARTALVLTPLSGRILDLKVALGDRVARGQILAEIDSPELAQAYDDHDKAADAEALTGRNLHRQEEQARLGTASLRDLDQARSDHAQAQAELTRADARLRVIGVPAGQPRDRRILTVRAPLSGSVTTLTVAPGNMINDPTQPLMTVADLSTVWVTAQVPEKDISRVAVGQTAHVRLDAHPDKPLNGKISFVSDVVEPDTRRNKVRIVFRNPDHLLKPNMFATVILLGAPASRVVLPSSAVVMNNDRISVFVETGPWTFERRTVEALLEEYSSVAIESGVNPGDRVVVKGGILLND